MLNTRVYVFKTHPLFKHAIRTHAGVCYIFNFMSCFLAEGLEQHCYLWGLWSSSSKAVKMTQTGRIWTWGGKKMVQAVKSRFSPIFQKIDWSAEVLKCWSADPCQEFSLLNMFWRKSPNPKSYRWPTILSWIESLWLSHMKSPPV